MCTAALLRLLAPPPGKNYLDGIKMLLQRKQALASRRRLTSVMPCRCRLSATPTRCSLLWKTLEAWVTFTNTDKSSRWFIFWHHTVHRTSGRVRVLQWASASSASTLLHFPESLPSDTATSAETWRNHFFLQQNWLWKSTVKLSDFRVSWRQAIVSVWSLMVRQSISLSASHSEPSSQWCQCMFLHFRFNFMSYNNIVVKT